MILLGVLILLLIIAYYFLFNIYEMNIEISPEHFYADSNTTLGIKVIPINSIGSRALFRSTTSEFEIIDGASLVKRFFLDEDLSLNKIKSRGLEGKVRIKI